MTKHLLAGMAAVVLMAGVASADNYPPAPSPSMPLAPPPAVSSPGDNSPPAAVAGSREVTIHKEADEKGNTTIEKDTHGEGVTGSSESHTKMETDRDSGSTTIRSKTTTKQE